jgi:uncharacterized protein (DUF1499 family)
MPTGNMARKPATPPGRFGLLLTGVAVAAAALALLSMPVAALLRIAGVIDWRAMLWVFGIDLDITAGAIVLALAAFVVSRKLPWRSFRLGGAAAAFVVAVAVMVPQARTVYRALRSPPINDITTDPDSPPNFVALLAERTAAHALSPVDYTATTAALQKTYYPDIAPVELKLTRQEAVERVLALIATQGWRVVASVPEEGRIEAVATTFWIGFSDDVVFRLTVEAPDKTRVDMRSKSRVGRGDVGTNAARVRAFMAALG